MRRLLRQVLVACVLLATPAMILSAAEEHAAEAGHEEPSILWKWFNFSILAAGLGYLVISKGGPYFRQRGEEIRKLIHAAEQVQAEAKAEMAEIDRKLAGLDSEAAAIRSQAKQALEAERGKIEAETAAASARLMQNAETEIATLAKKANRDLRAATADRALALAREKVLARLNPEIDSRLIAGFVSDLNRIENGTGGGR